MRAARKRLQALAGLGPPGRLAEQAPVEDHLGVDAERDRSLLRPSAAPSPRPSAALRPAAALRRAFSTTTSSGTPSVSSSTSGTTTSKGIRSALRISRRLGEADARISFNRGR